MTVYGDGMGSAENGYKSLVCNGLCNANEFIHTMRECTGVNRAVAVRSKRVFGTMPVGSILSCDERRPRCAYSQPV